MVLTQQPPTKFTQAHSNLLTQARIAFSSAVSAKMIHIRRPLSAQTRTNPTECHVGTLQHLPGRPGACHIRACCSCALDAHTPSPAQEDTLMPNHCFSIIRTHMTGNQKKSDILYVSGHTMGGPVDTTALQPTPQDPIPSSAHHSTRAKHRKLTTTRSQSGQ